MTTFSGLRGVLYARCSKDEQSSTSLPQQHEVAARWFESVGASLLDTINDERSGTLEENRRPGLAKLMGLVRRREDFEFVACYDLSRFGRFQDPNAYGYFFHDAHIHGKFFYFIQDQCASNDPSIGKVIERTIKQINAAEHSRKVATGAIRGQVARAKRGRWVGGFPPLGFDLLIVDRDGEAVEVHRLVSYRNRGRNCSATWEVLDLEGRRIRQAMAGPPPRRRFDEVMLVPGAKDRVELVIQIFTWYVVQQWGFKRIAAELNRRGVPSTKSRKWGPGAIRAILQNPVYKGWAVFNRRTSAKVFGIANRPDSQGNDHTKIEQADRERERTRSNARKDWFVVEGAYESPVPAWLVEVAEVRLDLARRTCGGTGHEPSGMNPRASRSPALLAGLVKCARCGGSYRAKSWKKGSYCYKCGTYMDGGSAACANLTVPRDLLEEQILEMLRSKILRSVDETTWKSEMREALQERYQAGFDDGRRLELIKRLNELTKRRSDIVHALSPKNLEFLNEEVTLLREQIDAVEREIAGLEKPAQAPFDVEEAVEESWRMAEKLRRALGRGNFEEKREMLKYYVRRVVVHPDEHPRAVVEYCPVGTGRILDDWRKDNTPTGI